MRNLHPTKVELLDIILEAEKGEGRGLRKEMCRFASLGSGLQILKLTLANVRMDFLTSKHLPLPRGYVHVTFSQLKIHWFIVLQSNSWVHINFSTMNQFDGHPIDSDKIKSKPSLPKGLIGDNGFRRSRALLRSSSPR